MATQLLLFSLSTDYISRGAHVGTPRSSFPAAAPAHGDADLVAQQLLPKKKKKRAEDIYNVVTAERTHSSFNEGPRFL